MNYSPEYNPALVIPDNQAPAEYRLVQGGTCQETPFLVLFFLVRRDHPFPPLKDQKRKGVVESKGKGCEEDQISQLVIMMTFLLLSGTWIHTESTGIYLFRGLYRISI